MRKRSSRIRVVLQARSTSTRLPGKSLIPIRAIPLAVLAGRRAGRSGLDVVVATSTDTSDDQLACVLRENDLKVFRGPLDDVLGRFVGATSDLEDDDLCVRLTGDNPVPDSELISHIAEMYDDLGTEYFGVWGGVTGTDLPYGLAIECIKVRLLREANLHATEAASREHLTAWIRQKIDFDADAAHRLASAELMLGSDLSDVRATIDTIDDLWRLTRAFACVSDPVYASWRDLCALLSTGKHPQMKFRMRNGTPHSTITLGTAQFGTPYGISNDEGELTLGEIERIVAAAIEGGVLEIDTARTYGSSEERLGTVLRGEHGIRIVSKFPSNHIPNGADRVTIRDIVDRTIEESLFALKREHLHGYLLHDAGDRTKFDGAVWERLQELQREGVIGRLGVSVYDQAVAQAAAEDPAVSIVQHPLNVLDPRWGFLEEEPRGKIAWCARSVLLQGLTTLTEPSRWTMTTASEARTTLEKLTHATRIMHCADTIELGFRFALAHTGVSTIVLGVTSARQLQENVERTKLPPLEPEQMDQIYSLFSDTPAEIYDPRLWTRN